MIMSWKDLSEQSDLVIWKFLINKNARDSNNCDQIDSDDDIDGNDKFTKREHKESSSPSPTVMLMDQK